MKQHVRIVLGMAIMAAVAACNKSDDLRPSGPKVHISQPAQTLAVGQEVVLQPEFTQDAGLSFRWTVNGQTVGTGPTYTFKPTRHGDYTITFVAGTAAGMDSASYRITVLGEYANGTLVLNEGWFGTQAGSVWFYRYGADTLVPWVYQAVNPGKTLGGPANTLQYGAIHNGKLYMVVKAGGPLVVAGASTLVETGRVENVAAGKGMSFVGIDATRGLIGATDGIYPINLATLAIGPKLAGISGATGNMVKSGNYVFAHNSTDGTLVLDAATYAVVSKPYKATIGFVQGKDGRIYGAKDSLLMSLHPVTLAKDSVKMPFRAVSPFGAWRSVQMTASTANDHIFIIQPGSGWTYGKKLYRYVAGNAASLGEPFITLPADQWFYGSGVNYDPHTDELVATTINGAFSGNVNKVLFFDAQTGALKKTITYNGWYFPRHDGHTTIAMKPEWKIRCAGACLLLAGSASAQTVPDSAKVRALQEVHVTAPRPVKEISPGQTLQGAQLQRLGAQSVADALRYFSGLQIKDYGGVGGLKTVDVRGMGTNHTAVFYDGVQLGNAQNGQVDLGKFSMENLQAVSLYNGQKSNTFQPAKDYSASAAIYLTPLQPVFRPGETFHLKGSVKAGSFSLLNPSVSYQQQLSAKVSLSLSTEWVHAGGQYKFRYRKVNGYDTTATRKNGDVGALRAEASLHGRMPAGEWRSRLYYYGSERGLPGFVVNGVFGHVDRQWDRNFFWQAHLRKDISKRYGILLNAKFAHDYTRYLAPDTLLLYVDNTYRQQEAYFSLAQQLTLKPWWTAGLSADYQFNLLDASLTNFSYPRRHTVLGALSTSATWPRFSAQAALLATLMHESVKKNAASAPKRELTPSLVVAWQPWKGEDLRVRGFYKHIFRMPTFNDLYYTDIGNTRLDPEYTRQYDIGLSWNKTFAGRRLQAVSLEADAYYNEVTGKIVAVPTVSQFRWTMMNLGLVRIHGLDLRAAATLLAWERLRMTGKLTYTFQQARDFTDRGDSFYGHQIVYLPRHAGSLTGSVDYGGWGLNCSLVYTGERYNGKANIPANYMQPWYTSDLSLRRALRFGKLETALTMQVNNLFNQYYDVVLNYPMPGRNYKAVLSVQL